MNQVKLYSKNNSLQKTDASYVLDNYFRLVNWNKDTKEKILDVGSGDGSVLLELLLPRIPASVEKLCGCDVSQEMIEFAKNRCNDSRVDFLQIDIQTQEVPIRHRNEFHHVFSFYCLHWVQNQKQAFKNIFELIAPGGDALIVFLASNPIFDIYESMGTSTKWSKYMQNYKTYISPYHHFENPVKELETLLEEVGFSIHLCRLENRSFTFASLETVEKATKAVNPFISKIPDNEVSEYVEDFIKEVRKLECVKILSCDNNNDNKIYITYKLFVVFVSKSNKK